MPLCGECGYNGNGHFEDCSFFQREPLPVRSGSTALFGVWLDCNKVSPEPMSDVLTYGPCGHVIATFTKSAEWSSVHCDNETGEPWLYDESGKPTHWTPLPDPPNK